MNTSKKKELSGKKALEYVKPDQVIGIGTGSTVKYFIEGLKKFKESVRVVPTSEQAHNLARGIDLQIIKDPDHIDIAVDGADQVDPNLNLIKGRGGAMVQEKIVDYGADRFFVVVDDSKMVKKLGGEKPVPVEVISRSWRLVKRKLESLKHLKEVNLRIAKMKDGPIVTDNGNFILDTYFNIIKEPKSLESKINEIPGVVDNGIFTGDFEVIVGKEESVDVLK